MIFVIILPIQTGEYYMVRSYVLDDLNKKFKCYQLNIFPLVFIFAFVQLYGKHISYSYHVCDIQWFFSENSLKGISTNKISYHSVPGFSHFGKIAFGSFSQMISVDQNGDSSMKRESQCLVSLSSLRDIVCVRSASRLFGYFSCGLCLLTYNLPSRSFIPKKVSKFCFR